VRGTLLGWGTPRLRWWECAIGWCMRGGLMGLKPKTKPPELSFGDCNVGGCDMGGWNHVEVRYTEVEVVVL